MYQLVILATGYKLQCLNLILYVKNRTGMLIFNVINGFM